MKHTKKLLSILLALVLALSCAAVALAQNTLGFNWTPIPTSPDGLQPGDLYLDFTPEFANANTGFSVEGVDYADCMSKGDWDVDWENHMVRGQYELPGDVEYEGNVIEYIEKTDRDRCHEFFYGAVREIGVEWQEVKLTANNLQDGDWYIDAQAAWDALIAYLGKQNVITDPVAFLQRIFAEMGQEATPENLVNNFLSDGLFIYPGSKIEMFKRIYPVNGEEWLLYPESTNESAVMCYVVAKGGIRQYKTPDPPSKPVEPGRESFLNRAIERIRDFFRRVGEFFKKLIRR